MNKLILGAGLALSLLAGCTDANRPEVIQISPTTAGYHKTDRKMNAAIAQARETLPKALDTARLASGGYASGLQLKVAVPSQRGTEVIWVGSIAPKGDDSFTGAFVNTPIGLPGKTRGSKVSFAQSAIFDWSLPAGSGRYFGNYTTRVIAADLPSARGKAIRATLTPRPTPFNW